MANIPVLRASGRRSSTTAWICASTTSRGMAWTAVTPWVFWAVTAVMTLVPKTRWAWNVLRSAWMPAPPPLSLPAMVRAMGWRSAMDLTLFVSERLAWLDL